MIKFMHAFISTFVGITSVKKLILLVALAVGGEILRRLACWDYRIESRWQYVCLSLVSVVYFQVELFATG
jgi:hypothetical protein